MEDNESLSMGVFSSSGKLEESGADKLEIKDDK